MNYMVSMFTTRPHVYFHSCMMHCPRHSTEFGIEEEHITYALLIANGSYSQMMGIVITVVSDKSIQWVGTTHIHQMGP